MITREKPKIVQCPACKKEMPWDVKNLYRPFCSERCKLIDLGEWAGEKHRIAGAEVPSDDEASEN